MSAGHEKIVSHDHREPPSSKSFGVTFAVIFAIIAFWPSLFRAQTPHLWSLALSVAFVAAACFAPGLLKPLNLLWFKLGMLLHKIVNPLVLGLLFLVFMTPIALALRLIGKKLMPLSFDPGESSYWIERTPPGPDPASLRQQF